MVREQLDPASWMHSNRTSKSGLRPARLTPELAFLFGSSLRARLTLKIIAASITSCRSHHGPSLAPFINRFSDRDLVCTGACCWPEAAGREDSTRRKNVDTAAYARRSAGLAGNLEQRYSDSLRKTQGPRNQRVLHSTGIRRTSEARPSRGCRAGS